MKTKTSISILAALLISTLSQTVQLGMAADEPPVAPSIQAQAAHLDPDADEVVHRLSRFYVGLRSLKATIVGDMHVSADGETSDNQTEFDFELERPLSLSFVMKKGRLGGTAKSDGKVVTLYSPQMGQSGVYLKAAAPLHLADLFAKPEFAFVSGGMSGLSLLEALISPDPYTMLMNGVTAVSIVGKEQIDGIETQHLHFSQKDLTWDLWVDTGKEPWVRKITPDVTAIMRQYQQSDAKDLKVALTIRYKETVANPEIPTAEFKYTPPAEAKEVTAFFGTEESAQQGARALLRQQAPDVKLDTLDGGKFDLSAHRGKDIVVLDFWTTWAPPCKKSLPLLAEITQEYAPKGVKFYAIDVKEEPGQVREFMKSENLNFPVAMDKDGAMAQAYGVAGIPQTVVIDPDGMVRDVQLGFDQDVKEKMADQFDIILSGKAPSAAPPLQLQTAPAPAQ